MKSIKLLILIPIFLHFALTPAQGQTKSKRSMESATDNDTASTTSKELKPRDPETNRFAAAVNLSFPEVLPFDFFYFPSKTFALRLYAAPPIRLGAKLLMDADSTTLNSRLKIATPEANIDLKILSGPIFGSEAFYFPMQGDFYIFSGISYRKLKVTAQDSEPLYICFVVSEVACDQSQTFLANSPNIDFDAEYISDIYALRAGAGWMWQLPRNFFINLNAGLTKPVITKRNVSVSVSTSDTTSSEGVDPNIKDGLSNLKNRKQAQLESKALAIAKRIDGSLLPLISIGLGYNF